METFLIYIGKVSIAAGAFYLAFLLLFQNQKHFNFNRIYLPASMLLSFVIPLITFTTVKYIETSPVDLNSLAYLSEETGATQKTLFTLEWYHYLFGLYILGIAGFFFNLLIGHLKALQIIKKSRKQNLFKIPVNITLKDVHPFSFFNKIVLSEKTLNSKDLEMIVSHENIHVQEKHTLDILFTEALFMAQWFNPFAWLIKDAVKNNLEYKTDHQVIKTFSPQSYQMAMVALADKKGVAPFLTALNGSQLKNRIIMMKKKTKNRFAFAKQMLILPLLAVLVITLSSHTVKTEIKTSSQVEVNASLNDLNDTGEKTIMSSDYISETNQEFDAIVSDNKETDQASQKETTISGKITNKKSETIAGAAVIVKGTTIGTISDAEGNYQIRTTDDASLVFIMVGYEKQQIEANNRTNIDVQLSPKKDTSSAANTNLDTLNLKGKSISISNNDSKLNGKVNQIKINGSFGENEPLYIVDGEEKESLSDLNPEEIESISVLKDKSATDLYGEKAKNGVVLVNTKTGETTFNSKDKTVIVDGKKYDGNINDIPVDEIASVSVEKDKTSQPYLSEDENANKSTIIINTKTKYNTNKEEDKNPLLVIDGEISDKNPDEIDAESVASINVLKGEQAINKYGETAKDGVIEITTKKPEATSAITTPLELRKFIAQQIKYPVEAQEKGQTGTVMVNVKIKNNRWEVVRPAKSSKQSIDLDEVVVVAYAKDRTTIKKEKSEIVDYPYLIEEVHRIIGLSPEIEIPEFNEKTINIAVKFVLQ